MCLLPRLWQRVFAYAILLILVSHLVSSAMFRLMAQRDMHARFLAELATNAASAIEGREKDSLGALIKFFEQSRQKMWIEYPDGSMMIGKPDPRFSPAARERMEKVGVRERPVTVLRDATTGAYLAEAVAHLREHEAVICLRLDEQPPPPLLMIFLQSLIAVCIVGGALSIWITWRIARPLNRLRSEVLQIAGGDLEARVGESGPEEIAQVARAVNSMAQSLLNNIRNMRQLVANLSHEMRSPLARMSISAAIVQEGLAALLASGTSRTSRAEDDAETYPRLILNASGTPLACVHIGYMLQEIEHMERLVGSSLLNSRLELQHEKLQMQPVDMSALGMDIVLRHEALIAERELSLSVDIRPDLWVMGDEALLSLVITNLLDNALKYTDRGGRLILGLDRQNGTVRLRVENTCPRMEDDVLNRLFEPFFRGEGTGNTQGAGLGLTLVRKIASCHRGSASAERTETGLRISVVLPAAEEEISD